MTIANTAKAGLITLIACLAGGNVAMAEGLKNSTPMTSAAKSIVLFSGYDAAPDSSYMYQGAVLALNRDIGRDGVLLRAYGSHGDYEYGSGVTRTDGDSWQGDAMIGYKVGLGHAWAAAYVGIEYQKHQLTPDDLTNAVRGTEVGFKVAADIASLRTEGPIYFSLSGSYSTAFDSYWARGRVGMNMHRITVGPEVAALGNAGFDATRVGGFLTFDLPITPSLPLEITLSAGHQFVGGSGSTTTGSGGGEGTYVGVSVSSVF